MRHLPLPPSTGHNFSAPALSAQPNQQHSLTSSTASLRAGRAALGIRAGGPAAKRQSRQDKQRRKAEELRRSQQGAASTAEGKKPAGALQWIAQQELQRELQNEAEDAMFLENLVVGGYFLNLGTLGVLCQEEGWVERGSGQLLARYEALRRPAYQHSITQYQASPSSSLVPPPQQGAFDDMGKLAQEYLLECGGPSATDFPQAHSLLIELWQPVLEKLSAVAYRSRFNSAGSVRQSRSLKPLLGMLDEVSLAGFREAHARVTKGAEEEEERTSRASMLEVSLDEADDEEEQEPELKPEVSAELRQQQEAKRAQRRARRAIRVAEAQARQVKEAEAARRKAAYRMKALRQLQAAAEHRAEGEAVQARERAERQQRVAVRHAQEHARTHTKLSARQRRLLETVREEAAEYNASR